ncbi:sensor histidine kinase [Ideonella sp.]|uniref:sensor histidine kinase n=1 Tax=Ideonella sp. TaxID=1929293 RepID=UPI003BB55AC6
MVQPPTVCGPSVRSQLLRPLLWSWLFGLCAAVAGAFLLARTSAELAFDRSLQDAASALAARVTWSDRGPLLDSSRQAMELLTWDAEDRGGFVMVDSEGNALAGDATVPVPPPALREESLQQPRVFDSEFHDETVRGAVFSVSSPMLDRRVSIVVVESRNKRSALMRRLQLSIVLPALALGAVTFSLIGWGIRRGLQPLRDVAAEVAQRDAHDWRPLSLSKVPREAVPLIDRINLLLTDMEQAIALQRRFVADAAHQLRTPVAGIRVLAQALAQELKAQSEAPERASWPPMLAQLDKSTERLSRLIGQLLSLARSETALAVDAEQQALDLVPLLREAAEPALLRCLRDGKTLELDAPPGPVWAFAHPLWLGEVLVNLLDNAVRYGGTQIVVRVRAHGADRALIQVEDDGAGVSDQQRPHLFEPFWRGERADLRNDGGTGLGLTIAREIVQRLGGQISAESRPTFEGMRFTILLQAGGAGLRA